MHRKYKVNKRVNLRLFIKPKAFIHCIVLFCSQKRKIIWVKRLVTRSIRSLHKELLRVCLYLWLTSVVSYLRTRLQIITSPSHDCNFLSSKTNFFFIHIIRLSCYHRFPSHSWLMTSTCCCSFFLFSFLYILLFIFFFCCFDSMNGRISQVCMIFIYFFSSFSHSFQQRT